MKNYVYTKHHYPTLVFVFVALVASQQCQGYNKESGFLEQKQKYEIKQT